MLTLSACSGNNTEYAYPEANRAGRGDLYAKDSSIFGEHKIIFIKFSHVVVYFRALISIFGALISIFVVLPASTASPHFRNISCPCFYTR